MSKGDRHGLAKTGMERRLRPETLHPVPRIDQPIDKDWAWGGVSGAGITVAVVDSGVDAAHPAVGR